MSGMTLLEFFELLSYIVTVVGLPYGIWLFMYERRREAQADEEEIYQRLSDEYTNFLKLVLENSDLQLLRKGTTIANLNDEQNERKLAIFGILISLLERAYILVYEEHMSKQTRRLWLTWEDYIREWCLRADFRAALPHLLEGEDEDFRRHILKVSQEAKSLGV